MRIILTILAIVFATGHLHRAEAWTRDQLSIAPTLMKQELLSADIAHPEIWQLAGRLAYHEGYGSSRPARRSSSWSLRPILAYDANANNGFANDAIAIGGLEFLVDERFRRKSAAVAGASLGGNHVWGLSKRISLHFDHTARYVHAIDADYDKWEYALQPCLNYFLSATSRAFACAAAERSVTKLSARSEKSLSFGMSRAYSVGSYVNSSQLTIMRSAIDSGIDYFQNSVTYQHQVLLGNAMLLSGRIKLSEGVEGIFSGRESFQISAARMVGRRRYEASIFQENRRGAAF
ncbi:hypothetical protein SAMN04488075_0487 [Paracoccus alkenifer]|uniref:Uncharacterized protein n=2 Tax=Paracoccus alkenifer TaxID=65735 RepID=A0A1H6JW99_9RHOB|nr:hypothetical protein SAMN04488075_0487 [Paracoccus alkenifer]